MTAQEEREMHDLAVALAAYTEGTGWAAMRYLAIGQLMQRLSAYCAVAPPTDVLGARSHSCRCPAPTGAHCPLTLDECIARGNSDRPGRRP